MRYGASQGIDFNLVGGVMDWRMCCITMNDQESYLLETGAYTDCIFKVGAQGEIFRAHKLILYRASSVFEAMILDGLVTENEEVRITDVEPKIFKLMLKFIYTDVIPDNLCVEDLIFLCLAANKYLLYNLRELCINNLCIKVDLLNVWTIFNLADILEGSVLYETALKVVTDFAQQVFNHSMFLELPHKTLVAIVKEENINVNSEMDVINACLIWAKQQCERRGIPQTDYYIRKILGEEIISNIRFLTLKPVEFTTGPGMSQWLTNKEKLSILMALSAPGKVQLKSNLCNRVEKRKNVNIKTDI